MDEYVETGGLRWTMPYGMVANMSWPFVTIRISSSRVVLRAKFWWILNKTFEFDKSELQTIRRYDGLMNTGAQFEHQKADYPSFLVYWTLAPDVLFEEFRNFGYTVLDEPKK